MDKDILRKEIIAKRDGLSSPDITSKSRKIFEKVQALSDFKEASNVLIYASMKSEVMTDDIIRACLEEGKSVYCPVCTDTANGVMEFVKIHSLQDLKEGYYGIREPLISEKSAVYSGEEMETSLCVVPGVAFDKMGNRIGYKGGYYDRYFERFPGLKKVALAFTEQIVDEISISEYDVPVDAVVTDA